MPTPRLTYCSVTIFLKHGDRFLFLQRPHNQKVDSGRVNGVGGKVEADEDYLAAAIRETLEETGYHLAPEEFKFRGCGRIQGGYPQDWLITFFTAEVNSLTPPLGTKTPDGELFWATVPEILSGKYNLVDDIHVLLPIIAENKNQFFFTAHMDEQEKLASFSFSQTPL